MEQPLQEKSKIRLLRLAINELICTESPNTEFKHRLWIKQFKKITHISRTKTHILGIWVLFHKNTSVDEVSYVLKICGHRIQSCLLPLGSDDSPPFLGFAGATFAGVERSDWENLMRMFIRTVTMPNPTAVNEIPFHEDRSEDHCKNFRVPKIRRHAQEITTCSPAQIFSWSHNCDKPPIKKVEKTSTSLNQEAQTRSARGKNHPYYKEKRHIILICQTKQILILPKGTLLAGQCLEILLHQMCLLLYACPIRYPGQLRSNSKSITRMKLT